MTKRVLGILGLLLVWEVAARFIGSRMFSPVSLVLPAFWRLAVSGELVTHSIASMHHFLVGFGSAAVAGVILGTLVAESRLADYVFTPVIDAMRPIAALTMFPLLITVLGLGVESKAFVIFWTSWPAVTLNTTLGLRSVDQQVLEAGQLDGCTRTGLLFHLKVPLAISMLMTGLRIGISGGWISLVSAEMLGSNAGLGYSILRYSQTFRFPEMYAIIITIALVGLAFNIALAVAQRYLEYRVGGMHVDSPFIRFHDRASSFSLDTIKVGHERST